ncbi:MAG: FAD:protein FMN transferase [Gammaproteobacteria bacterium]|nr:FAD:protein FMN transferase [Gammaproteobacteria bacterium]
MYRTTYQQLIKILLFSVCLLVGCETSQQIVEQRILQFGTVIDITLVHSDIDKAESTLHAIEQQLQQYRTYWHAWEDSDLYRFNQSLTEGKTTPIPESLIELINLSQDYYHSSQQLFNPAIGKLVAAYGFHGNDQPNEELIRIIQQDMPTMLDLKIASGMASSDNPHLLLDLGGIAKGYAISLVANYLKKSGFGHFLINAGGDLISAGTRLGKPWTIGIQNPFKPGAIAKLTLEGDQNLFTSGNYQRYYLENEKIVHHIIDPRTGKPSQQISSATVLADDPVLADVAATTLMIDGWRNHATLAQSLDITDYLIVSDEMEIIVSRALSSKIEFTTDTPYIIVNDKN